LQEFYAQPASSVVGSTQQQSAIPFKQLLGESHWKRRFAKLYQEQKGQWLTPTEIFRPFYSNVIARYIAESVDHRQPLNIIELGGGRGTNAVCMMDFLQQTFPELYERTNYTIVDASPTLIELQREILGASQHSHKMVFSQKDLVEVGEGKTHLVDDCNVSDFHQQQCFIVGLELLDNLPHDKIRVRNTKVEQAELVAIVDSNDGQSEHQQHYEEVFRPLSDPLLTQIISAAPIYKRMRRGGGSWIPSTACGLLHSVQKQVPNCQIVMADFDFLPASDAVEEEAFSFPADGQPLVTDMNDVDYACYLEPTDTATDILFPTNFEKLAAYSKVIFPESKVTVKKQADFLQTFGAEEVQATSSWLTRYSPLIHDYENCSVLLISKS